MKISYKLKLIATQGHYNDSNLKKKNIADIFKFNNLCKIGVFSFLNDMKFYNFFFYKQRLCIIVEVFYLCMLVLDLI